MKVVVAGGGIAGLTVASLLSRSGAEVTLLERNPSLGGRARVLKEKGYEFDMGPSWYLMPEVLDKLFERLKRPRPYDLQLLSPSFKLTINWEKEVTIYLKPEENKEELNKLEERGFEKMERYLEYTGYMYRVAVEKFLYREYRSLRDFLTREVMLEALRMGILSTMERFNRRFFKSEEMLTLTGFASVFLGGAPDNVPGIYALVNYPIFGQGVYYPKGGFGSVVKALSSGFEVRLGEEVRSAVIEGGKLTKLKTSKGEVEGDYFVFAGDYRWFDREVLPSEYSNYPEGYWRRRVYAPSAILAFVGVRERVEEPHHHVVIRGDMRRHFDAIFRGKPLPEPEGLSYYVSIRSRSEPGIAPEGGEALFFLIPVPPGFRGDVEGIARRVVGDYLSRHKVREVDYFRVYGPSDFQADYNATLSTAFGLAHTLFQTAVFRPSMRNRKVRNLFYAGQYTHPGIGVPMVAISGQLVAEAVLGSSRD
jgi:phytoene desaturase